MWIDISVPLVADAPAWPGDTPFSARWTWSQKTGGSVNVSAITLSPHVGTHADAPFHIRRDGAKSERLPLAAFLGRCTVIDVSAHGGELHVSSLGALARGNVERVLLKTGHGVAGGQFPEAWPWLALDTVRDLLRRGLRLLGVDAPSIDAKESKTLDVHHALFAAGAYNLENLDLRYVAPGAYELFAAPLAVSGIDAAPVRALLRPLP